MIKKYTTKFVKVKIEKECYKLLSKRYRNSKIKLEFQCPEGHKFLMSWNTFQQGHRCPICYGIPKLTYEFIKGKIENEGYKLLSKEYKNAHKKLDIECSKGHIFKMKWNTWQQGGGCPYCSGYILTIEFIKGEIEKVEGYKLLSKQYKGSHKKLLMKCPEGHKYMVSWNYWKQGCRCPQCNRKSTSSKGEIEVLEYIQSITDTTIISNDRTQIINPKTGCNLELDIFLPDSMKAIEYNGTYWHSDKETKYRDNQKVIQCKEKGIDFLIVNENEWTNNNKETKNNIKKFI